MLSNEFKNLTELVCDEIRQSDLDLHLMLAKGEVSPKLKRLHLNTNRLESTDYEPAEGRLNVLRCLYEHLTTEGIKEGLQVFVNGVRISLDRAIADYRFEDKLITVHHRHVTDGIGVDSCRSIFHCEYLDLLETFAELKPAHGEPERIAQHFGFAKFAELYNIRSVYLDNSNRGELELEEETFLVFLENCRSLVELRIICSGFSSMAYRQLSSVKSCLTLNTFVLTEPAGFPKRIRFEFIAPLRYLRHFHTNVADRATMIELVSGMETFAEYRFRFCGDQFSRNCYNCKVRKVAGDQFELFTEKQNLNDASVKQVLHEETVSLDQLKAYFSNESHSHLTAHWLDEPQKKKL